MRPAAWHAGAEWAPKWTWQFWKTLQTLDVDADGYLHFQTRNIAVYWPGGDATQRRLPTYGLSTRDPRIMHWPAMDMQRRLYVRSCWPALWAGMLTEAHANGGTAARLALAGSSGTGRRLFLLYALWRLARDRATLAVVLQCDSSCRLAFTRQDVFIGDGEAFADVLQLPGSWLLADENGLAADAETSASNVIMVTTRRASEYEVWQTS